MEEESPKEIELLLIGTYLICPHCLTGRNSSNYTVLGLNPRFSTQLERVYRCPKCKHFFALRTDL